jgi:hypothetical protein
VPDTSSRRRPAKSVNQPSSPVAPVPASAGPPVQRNALNPEQMPPAARLRELTSLLAAGFLRNWLKKAADDGEKCLAILRTSSEVCPKPSSEGESL